MSGDAWKPSSLRCLALLLSMPLLAAAFCGSSQQQALRPTMERAVHIVAPDSSGLALDRPRRTTGSETSLRRRHRYPGTRRGYSAVSPPRAVGSLWEVAAGVAGAWMKFSRFLVPTATDAAPSAMPVKPQNSLLSVKWVRMSDMRRHIFVVFRANECHR
jgi:hypothetical protein